MGLHKLPSVKLILHKLNKKDKDGYIYLRCGIPGEKRYVIRALNHKIAVDYWNSEDEVVKSKFHEAPRINGLIQPEKQKLIDVLDVEYKKGVLFDEAVIRSIMFAGETGDFLAFYRAYIDNIIATKKQAPGSIAVWETQHKELKAYCKGKLTFSQVTGEYLNKYHEFLCAKKPPYEPTTLHKKLKKIKQIVDLAVKLKKIPSDQVAAFDMISYEEPDTNYLTYDHIKAIEKLLYTGNLDAIPNLKLTTAFFLVECLAGIRFSDWGKFKVEKLIHNRNLKVRTTKNGQPVYLDLTVFKSLDRIVKYIAANGMEWNESEGTANAQLKVLGINLGLSFALCTHDGRRSYGTLLGELGYSTRFIAEAMGITETTAKRYVKVTRQSLNAEMKRNGGI